MLGKTHRPFAVAAAAGTLLAVQGFLPMYDATGLQYLGRAALTIGGAYLSASLPDIDKAFPWHRGITHAIWIPAVVYWLAFYQFAGHAVWQPLLFGIFIGYMSHLVSDAFSKAGVAWFYPLQGYIRYDSGAFVVKGPRGPFLPLYEVGDPAFFLMPYLWWGLALALLLLLGRGAVLGKGVSLPWL